MTTEDVKNNKTDLMGIMQIVGGIGFLIAAAIYILGDMTSGTHKITAILWIFLGGALIGNGQQMRLKPSSDK